MKRRQFLLRGLQLSLALRALAPVRAPATDLMETTDEADSSAQSRSPDSVASPKQVWMRLTPEQRTLMQERWTRFQALSPAEQTLRRDAYAHLQKLAPKRRRRLLAGIERWQTIDAQSQAQLRSEFQNWKNLSANERRQLRDSFLATHPHSVRRARGRNRKRKKAESP